MPKTNFSLKQVQCQAQKLNNEYFLEKENKDSFPNIELSPTLWTPLMNSMLSIPATWQRWSQKSLVGFIQSWSKAFIRLDASNKMVNYSHLLMITWLVMIVASCYNPCDWHSAPLNSLYFECSSILINIQNCKLVYLKLCCSVWIIHVGLKFKSETSPVNIWHQHVPSNINYNRCCIP